MQQSDEAEGASVTAPSTLDKNPRFVVFGGREEDLHLSVGVVMLAVVTVCPVILVRAGGACGSVWRVED